MDNLDGKWKGGKVTTGARWLRQTSRKREREIQKETNDKHGATGGRTCEEGGGEVRGGGREADNNASHDPFTLDKTK